MGDSLDARVLLCVDPRSEKTSMLVAETMQMMWHRFGGSEKPSSATEIRQYDIKRTEPFRFNNVEYLLIGPKAISTAEVASDMMAAAMGPDSPPYASMVLIDTELFKEELNDGRRPDKCINKMAYMDPLMPIVAIGPMDAPITSKLSQGGVKHFAEDEAHVAMLEDVLFGEFDGPDNFFSIMTKFGGSADDYNIEKLESANIVRVCRILTDIIESPGSFGLTNELRLIGTVGAGKQGDIDKGIIRSLGIGNTLIRNFPGEIIRDLQDHANYISGVMNENGNYSTSYTDGRLKNIINDINNGIIPLFSSAPHYLLFSHQIPLSDSDTHSLLLGEIYKARKLILIKRTDGIYLFDPLREKITLQEMNEHPLISRITNRIHRYHQRNNIKYSIIKASDMIAGKITRDGTNKYGQKDKTTNHLAETSMLDFFLDKCKHVQEIYVVHVAPEEMYFKRKNKWNHIITKEKLIDYPRLWYDIQLKNILTAINGTGGHKIIRQ
ncbi:MAG: hypothetical protein ABIC95_06980 [archaeon]